MMFQVQKTGISQIRNFLCSRGRRDNFKENMYVAKEAFDAGLKKAKPGSKKNGLGKAAHKVAKQHGLTVIKNLTGHGVGRSIHEGPKHIFNYFTRWDDEILKDGMVIAFEPFISTFEEEVFQSEDGWTFLTNENKGMNRRLNRE